MHLILLGLGVATIVAGGAMIGFGIPINEFGLGNTLIAAGTTAVVGGLVVVGLAAALRQLTRIAAMLDTGSPVARTASAPPPAASPDPVEPGRLEPIPVAVVPLPGIDQGKIEPPLPAQPPEPEAAVPPSSRTPARVKGAEAEPPPAAAGKPAPAARPVRPAPKRGEIPVVLSPRERGFDSAWPSSEPATGKPEQGETPAAGGEGDPRADRAPAVSILKSGVIDGMAYTLYSDGSIEADLPPGTMRFSTIEELRVYLAGTS